MKRISKFSTAFALPLVALATMLPAGCNQDAATDPAAATGDAATAEDVDSDDPFAKLSEADRAAALAQKMCPVGDSPLGSMGTPVKVTIEGRDVYLCCEHCREALEADPQKYFAILDGTATPAEEDDDAAPEADAAGDAATDDAAG